MSSLPITTNKEKAAKRWALLKHALLPQNPANHSNAPDFNAVSVRRHRGLALYAQGIKHTNDSHYSVRITQPYALDLRFFHYETTREDFIGKPSNSRHNIDNNPTNCNGHARAVDNTGNIEVWPCEHVLTHFALDLLKNEQISLNSNNTNNTTRILELAAGQSGMAGLALYAAIAQMATAAAGHAPFSRTEILVTDGHPTSHASLAKNIQLNSCADKQPSHVAIGAALLKFDRNDDYKEYAPFDYILAADCLFFRDFHVDLAHTVHRLLSIENPDARAYFIQPHRGTTLHEFVKTVENHYDACLAVEVCEEFDEKITQLHQRFLEEDRDRDGFYDPDIHRPVLLIVKRKSNSNY